jgi:drug/metabolite transporter (DMT)-like permease
MSVWTAIALTLVSSAAMNLGLVLQKKGLTRSHRGPAAIENESSRFRPSPTWYAGLALLIGGYAVYLMAVSARSAPISLLQPLFASGLLVVAFLAVVYLNERLGPGEWTGVGLLLVGVILIGLSAEEPQTLAVGLDRTLFAGFLTGAGMLVAILICVLQRPHTSTVAEFLFGILTGVLLGTGYLNTKVVAIAWQEGSTRLVIVAVACMAIGLIGGLCVLQIAFRSGRALIVTAVNLVTNQLLVVAGGLYCLGERFPNQGFPFAARVGGLVGILSGILMLARLSTAMSAAPAVGRHVRSESKP